MCMFEGVNVLMFTTIIFLCRILRLCCGLALAAVSTTYLDPCKIGTEVLVEASIEVRTECCGQVWYVFVFRLLYIDVLYLPFLCSVFCCLLSLASCMCVLSDTDIALFHIQLPLIKYWIYEMYVCVCVYAYMYVYNKMEQLVDML